jgi:hypothetical protein
MKHPAILLHERIQIYRHAEWFERASHFLLDDKFRNNFSTVPGVVNSAFALEVYLKCLLHIETGMLPKKRPHLLKKALFDKLTAAHRDRINELYTGWAKTNATNVFAGIPLESHLAAIDDTYVHWRYLYEHPTSSRMYTGAYVIDHVKAVIAEEVPQVLSRI